MISANHICPLLLAAGQSRRFGGDKLLHPLQFNKTEKAIILHSLRPWISVFDKVNVVVRSDNHALIDLLKKSEFASCLRLIVSPNADVGMSASIVSGVEANIKADSWLIGLADMPYIQSDVIKRSAVALESKAHITLPTFIEKHGHPVGFSRDFLPELLSLRGDRGAKHIIAASLDKVTYIESHDNGILVDIDTRQGTQDSPH